MGLVTTIITLIVNPHMCQINMLLVVMFLVIWKIPLDLLYLLKRSLIRNLSLILKKKDSMFERVDQLAKEVLSLKTSLQPKNMRKPKRLSINIGNTFMSKRELLKNLLG